MTLAPLRTFGKPSRRKMGFTFAEVLAALLFLAIVLPSIMMGITLANRAALVAERKAMASQLGDSLLSEWIATEEWQSSASQGTFAPQYPEYSWTFTRSGWSEDSMQLLTLTVQFQVQNRPFYVQLSSLANESLSTANTSTPE